MRFSAVAASFAVACLTAAGLTAAGFAAGPDRPAAPELEAAADVAEEPIDFNRDVRPILSNKCNLCHGNDEAGRSTPLRFDTPEGAFVELNGGGHAIVPGDPAASVLLDRVTDEYAPMPPEGEGDPLTPAEVDTLRRWIEQGAEWTGHWAFEPIAKPPVPSPSEPVAAAHNEIDAFLNEELAASGLPVNGEASKTQLIRRATFTLTGLPPTPAEVDAFLNDDRPDAYERLVDRLLASPRYGERRARYWLDAARYGDTHGLHLDNERSIWPYRDWVVRAFNENKPFDEFTVEQLAGDLLPEPSLDQLIATGFNRCNVTTSEGGSIDEEYRVRYAVDRTETVGTVFMGLTVGCAACHDHKFDPISQKEFYSLYAYYRSAADAPMDGNALLPPPSVRAEAPWQTAERGRLQSEIAAEEHAFRSYIAGLDYAPAPESAAPLDPAERADFLWVDDALPAGAKPEGDEDDGGVNGWSWYPEDEGPVKSGAVGWERNTRYQGQSFFTGATDPVVAREGDTAFVHVFVEYGGNPGAIMLQVHTKSEGWDHRAIWGNKNAINFGTVDTPSRLPKGKLPERRQWTRLEVPLSEIGIEPGDEIDGLAFTQKGGHVRWDAAGFKTTAAPALRLAAARTAWEAAVTESETADRLPAEIAAVLGKPAEQRGPEEEAALADYFRAVVFPRIEERFAAHETELNALRAAISRLNATVPNTLVMRDENEPRPAFVLERGEYDNPTDRVYPGTPAVLPPLPEDAPQNRLTLARWLVDPDHPLTARVTVNRLWQQHFGTGLVRTSEDFGFQGEWPSHPELLDWLAAEFIESGWDVKALHRRIVLSAAFRRSAEVGPEQLQVDPDNRLLARGPRYRLDAEAIRDAALAASGLLVERLGGPGVKPYQPDGLWEAVGYTDSNTAKFQRDDGDALHRRSLYTFWKRTSPPPSLSTFDAPSRESCVVRRSRTNTPLQALALMNDVQFVEASRHLAARLLTEGDTTDEARLTHGFRLTVGRTPEADELAVLKRVLTARRSAFAADPAAATDLLGVGATERNESLDPVEHAAFTLLASLLMNTDAFVTQ
ncbi:PSD1 and planctomycete cytochrome C domain-containing protein [Alienimonas sp. DA493]|uniref:PSD1 and planctomycete cytochrome C domain-containing protein n=1 Tax=Alienimonas sp. DA493 TaxID=3373605 RepID=UPI0037549EE9